MIIFFISYNLKNETISLRIILSFENHVLPRTAGSSMGVVRDCWLCLRSKTAEVAVPLGVGLGLFCILNIEYRTRNFEQQKFLKAMRQCFSLRYSAVPCSAVLRFIFSRTCLQEYE
jgi:hypothetical protein